MKFLLHDSDSLGYDFRDFEAVVSLVQANSTDDFFIYTRATNIDLFAHTLSGPNVHYIGYAKHAFANDSLAGLCAALAIPSERVRPFASLYAELGSLAKLRTGELVPSGASYLKPPPALVENYLARLRAVASSFVPLRVVFAVVSGLKPKSDVGESQATRYEEGRRQTYPLEEIAQVARHVQDVTSPRGLAFVPLCVQYGNRREVAEGVARVNQTCGLKYPIQVVDDVDWDASPHQQAACYAALKQFASESGVPTIAYGNASTYLHLILASAGAFDAIAVALHGYPVEHPRDGRAYLRELSEHLDWFQTFTQERAGSWDDVTVAIQRDVERAIARATQTRMG
ncbi:MAG: hypothetical protein QM756_02320 [Polyangiaceae bacterium]